MPELPEIETVKLQLDEVLRDAKLLSVKVFNPKMVQGKLDHLVGQKILGFERKGKVLLIKFSDTEKLGFHFKMTGQLIYEIGDKRIVGGHPSEDFVAKMPNSHTRVIFEFDRGKLYFNDQRMFGWVMMNPKFVDKLGPEPFEMTIDQFVSIFCKVKKSIKVAMMDQERISGVGNIYANDACWEAEIRPNTSAAKLSTGQLKLLFEKLVLVLSEGIKYGGATSENYVNLHGLGGHYQDHFRVYNREGDKCLRNDGGIIEKTVIGGRGTYFCPVCQT